MDRKVNEYLKIENKYSAPYTNHYGYVNSIGCCDAKGRGRAFVMPRNDYDYNGKSIISYNHNKVYMVNDFMLYITHIRGPWAKAEIIKNDLTTQSCYIGKINNHIVVSESIRDAIEEMRNEIFNSMDNDEDIARAFVYAHPEYEKEYDWDEMVTWHSLDRTSCMDGRRRFSMYANKDTGSTATPKELISFMKESPSYRIAEKMERIYLNNI